jgi:iron(III) transport system ATP-binding protein
VLTISNLVKQYRVPAGKGVESTGSTGVDDVSLEIAVGEFFTLLGPSGCGKTTTLRSVAGLETPDSGRITLGDRVLFDSGMHIDRRVNQRGLAMVFQSYAIWPHMSVFENAAFPLRVAPRKSRLSGKQIRERVDRSLAVVGLDRFADQSATRLSGGQQQRLALARAIVIEPPILLLDEPLSNLDAKLRESMRIELKRLQRDLGITAVYVTHDQAEALSMSSRIAVMDKGKVIQVAAPRDLYQSPASQFVADFLGESNFIETTVTAGDAEGLTVDTPFGSLRAANQSEIQVGQRVIAVLRPEDMTISAEPPAASTPNVFKGQVITGAFLGDRIDHLVSVRGGLELRVRSHKTVRLHRNSDVHLWVDPSEVVLLAQ